MASGLEREVLLGPDLVARGAASVVGGKTARWMLHQPKAVRRSYVDRVMDRPEGVSEERAQTSWMLRQGEKVRSSYITYVLRRKPEPPSPQVLWMLGQPDPVRESYAEQVVENPAGPKPEVVWMLRQPDAVRESYIAEVIATEDEGPEGAAPGPAPGV